MRATAHALLAVLLVGCGRLELPHPSAHASAPRRAALEAEAVKREDAFKAATRDGWPSKTDCDGTVWMGVACLAGIPAVYDLAEYPAGTLNRRPGTACWVPEKAGEQQPSATTASGDDETLYAACAFKHGDRGALERQLDHASADSGYIGLPHLYDTTHLAEGLKNTIERAVQDLGGAPASAEPIVELPPGKDYQVHIVTEAVDFAVQATGGVSGWELALMVTLAGVATPTDALVQGELGVYTRDFRRAEDLLLDPSVPCPSYARGDQAALFCQAWWLRAARIVLDHTKESQ